MKDPLRSNAIHSVDNANANRILSDVNVRPAVPAITDSPTAKSAIAHPRLFAKRIQVRDFETGGSSDIVCNATIFFFRKTPGACICPPRVTGEKCDKCEPYTFGFDQIIGCELCNCQPLGVEHGNLQCDLNNGTCA